MQQYEPSLKPTKKLQYVQKNTENKANNKLQVMIVYEWSTFSKIPEKKAVYCNFECEIAENSIQYIGACKMNGLLGWG